MMRGLTSFLCAAVERRLRDCMLGVIAAVMVGLFAAVSLGFGTFAAYVYVRGSEGRVVAALIVCAAYGLLALAILTIRAVRRRAGRLRRAGATSAPASPGDVDALLQTLAAAGAPQDQPALAAAMQLGRELSPMQLLALAVIGGFIAGRKLRK
jgi:hypothetical protein